MAQMNKHRATIEDLNKRFRTSASIGDLETVKQLCERRRKEDLDVKNSRGLSPLTCAVIGGQYEVARFLLRKGANVRQTLPNGQTPLHLACFYNYEELVKLLLRFKARREVKDKAGKTPAELTNSNEIKQLLRKQVSSNVIAPHVPHEVAEQTDEPDHAEAQPDLRFLSTLVPKPVRTFLKDVCVSDPLTPLFPFAPLNSGRKLMNLWGKMSIVFGLIKGVLVL
eukprot:GCRY01005795.1.p1 GENE.GCRY01005795.1~~GCRY01005795.1.p1  ORF type:complete len:224 (-),score=16.53 GCRY01005795.1:592-1263(-)